MSKLGYGAFDADNHYYEAEDAFTRHLDPSFSKRAMQWAHINGKKRLLVGGKVNRFIPNPTWDPIARPGSLDDYFRGKVAADDIRDAFGTLDPLEEHPEYLGRDHRITVMDEQGLEAAFFFPTLGVGMEAALEGDRPAMLAAFSAFNRWMDDDWGYAFENRIFAAPYITLADVDWAIAELESAIERDARVIVMRPSSVLAADGTRRSLGHPDHEPFWERLAESGITLAMHSGDAGYGFFSEFWGLESEFEAFRYNPLRSLLSPSPIADALASLIGEGVLSRHQRIRVATIETGSTWVAPLFQRLEKAYKQHKHAFLEDPIEVFGRQVWVSPYYEDDLIDLKDRIGASHIIFGSDYPHAEGLADPTGFIDDLTGYTDDEIKLVMRDNGLSLVGVS